MLTLIKKEVNGFLSSLIGYIVIGVFLTTIGLFMWIFPSEEFNILDTGYANIDTLFVIAPWVFMFLVSAVTMRSFAEEKRSGTMELLYTRPLTDWQIIFAKYFAGFLLVFLALLPTLIYYFSVITLGSPVGNIDSGGAWGSYIGLLFLASGFVAIGVFASALTDNQIVSFILAIFLCFFCFVGFESIAALELFGPANILIERLGINDHYISMSRGVLDTRDMLYFISLTSLFLLATKLKLVSRKW